MWGGGKVGGNYANVGAAISEGGTAGNLGVVHDGVAADLCPSPKC